MHAYLLTLLMFAQSQKPRPVAVPPRPISNLMFIADVLNDKCRGGSGDDPNTMRACEIRDGVITKIKELGWCWGHEGQAGYEKDWEPCPKSEAKPN